MGAGKAGQGQTELAVMDMIGGMGAPPSTSGRLQPSWTMLADSLMELPRPAWVPCSGQGGSWIRGSQRTVRRPV